MKTTLLSLLLVALCSSFAMAQQPAPRRGGDKQITPATMTPEMWYYSQEQRRHDDPQQSVRRQAEVVRDQRTARMAALKWYGMSNSRPVASTTPTMGVYSPAWVGNGHDRYDWVGLGWPHTAGYVAPGLLVR